MKRKPLFLLIFLLASASRTVTAQLYNEPADGAAAAAHYFSRATRADAPADSKRAFDISRVDKTLVGEFQKAWMDSRNGTSNRESVVLIFRLRDGTLVGRSQGCTNEDKRFTFKWHPAAIAVVHTHPNHCSPLPCGEDRQVADKYGVPVLTITIAGMYMYDPAERRTTRVKAGLEWLEPSSYARASVR